MQTEGCARSNNTRVDRAIAARSQFINVLASCELFRKRTADTAVISRQSL